MQAGFLQFDVTGNLQYNLNRLEFYLEQQRCDIIILPELFTCGYLFETRKELMSRAENIYSGRSTEYMIALSEKYSCTIVFGLAEKENENIFNTAVIVSKGKYIGKYRKIHLSDYEKKLFERGDKNQIFDVDGIKIGVQICFDLWFPEISREQIRMGADLLCVSANFGGHTTYHISKIRAIENLTPLILCNRIGSESVPGMQAEFLGKSTIIDPSGQRIYTAPEKKENFGFCNLEIPSKKSNIICTDFDSEIALHYQMPSIK